MVFFGDFLDAPPPTHRFTPPFLGKGKVLRWYLSGPSLMCMWFVVPNFSNFKCFGRRKRHDFRLIWGCFYHYSPKWGQIGLKSWPVMQYHLVNHICYNFYCNTKEWWKFSQKNDFLGPFLGVFGLHPLTPYELRPNSRSNKMSHRDT